MFFSTAAVLSTLASLAAAQTVHTVDVGLNNLTFTPDNVNAVPGDTVMFVFHAKNQCVPTLAPRSTADARSSVTQSTFPKPCTPKDGGVNTGFMPYNASDPSTNGSFPVSNYSVTASTAVWFFCVRLSPSCA
jgi:hypothetical protein